jgi:hypothetical protein
MAEYINTVMDKSTDIAGNCILRHTARVCAPRARPFALSMPVPSCGPAQEHALPAPVLSRYPAGVFDDGPGPALWNSYHDVSPRLAQ